MLINITNALDIMYNPLYMNKNKITTGLSIVSKDEFNLYKFTKNINIDIIIKINKTLNTRFDLLYTIRENEIIEFYIDDKFINKDIYKTIIVITVCK